MKRRPVNKGRSVKKFRNQAGKTKSMNIRPGPMRGGIRL